MSSPLAIAMAAGLAIATVNAFFARRDGRSAAAVVRTFLGWLLAFALAGLVVEPIGTWLLTHVF